MSLSAAEDAVLVQVREILAGNFNIAPEKVVPQASFRGSFGMDSLDIVDLVFFLQKQFALSGELDDYRELHTVQKLCRFIVERSGS